MIRYPFSMADRFRTFLERPNRLAVVHDPIDWRTQWIVNT